MAMPNHLVLVRHGQSEGNVATDALRTGDRSWYTEAFTTTPGHRWRLTDLGRAEAATIGAWITESIGAKFDTYLVSPYVRTRESACEMGLPDAEWRLNRALRERDWGEIGSLPRDEFESRPEYHLSALMKSHDPLYWRAPNGESIAGVAEDRVRNVLSTLHREATGQKVIAVTHGEAMWAFRLVLERISDERYFQLETDTSERIRNCEVLHYTRLDPDDGTQASHLSWLRRAAPIQTADGWTVDVTPWRKLTFHGYSNDELREQVSKVLPFGPHPHPHDGVASRHR
jgi:broad specificity phosphatase PhoE